MMNVPAEVQEVQQHLHTVRQLLGTILCTYTELHDLQAPGCKVTDLQEPPKELRWEPECRPNQSLVDCVVRHHQRTPPILLLLTAAAAPAAAAATAAGRCLALLGARV